MGTSVKRFHFLWPDLNFAVARISFFRTLAVDRVSNFIQTAGVNGHRLPAKGDSESGGVNVKG
jgi:hypothetical protein